MSEGLETSLQARGIYENNVTLQAVLDNHPGKGTSYVGQYGMLGYTWVIFEKFSVLFPRDGYNFSTKFLYFFCKVGIYFEENFCICQTRWNPFARNFLYFISQSCYILHITYFCIFLHDGYLFKRFTVVVGTN